MNVVSEGKAHIRTNEKVFFNPKMSTLRDMSVAFLLAYGCAGKTLLDATAATGVRAIRYYKECGIGSATAIDINKNAYKLCRKNILLNNVDVDCKNVSIQEFANNSDEKFDIIDLDPFGSPAPDIYDLMKISKDGTVLMATATDTAVLCGAHSAACLKQYNSKPLHNELCKEVGIRILMCYISRIAAQFNFGSVPLMCISDMHYMRVFIKLESGAKNAYGAVRLGGIGTFCHSCGRFDFKRGVSPLIGNVCADCSSEVEGFGPLWLGNLYDKGLSLKVAKAQGSRLAECISKEFDTPLFYSVPKMTKRLGLSSISHYKVIEALSDLGYTATATQFDDNGIKTNATAKEVSKCIKALSRSNKG